MTSSRSQPVPPRRPLPGDPRPKDAVAAMIRVDQAGEYGAKRIYEGQIAVLSRRTDPASRHALEKIRHMAAQEDAHLATFNRLIAERRVRPTVLSPLWHVGGWLMGAGTALLGTEAAMACTVAVESVIDKHYADQLQSLDDTAEPELHATIARFREEEIEHHDTGLAEGAEQAPLYPLLSGAIRAVTRTAIKLSTRL